MRITVETLALEGNDLLKENHLPIFRDKIQNKQLLDQDLLEEERTLFGYQTGMRVLPYLMQDVYSRQRKQILLKTIVMENDHVKAVFLPAYGMRLYSLFSKDENRELLFRNPVLQFANLAIRNAWFSGGIEWNIGQLGHTFTTCSSLFAAIVKDESGEEFLRAYEYERCKGVYWQMDFHLPDDARELIAYVRFINPKKEAVPFYWWTNIAVPEEKGIRVFSGNANVIYNIPQSLLKPGTKRGMSHGAIPSIDSMPGDDASYPQRFTFSSEYFFQNQEDIKQTWEIALYDDGTAFFDRSSPNLRYHKMFCWGKHRGGRRWKDFLAKPGQGDYVELQAGLAPTQLHGLDMPGETAWDFVQVFGGFIADPTPAHGSWEDGKNYLYEIMNGCVSDEAMEKMRTQYQAMADAPIQEILHEGTGYGALEEIRSPGAAPKGLRFPVSSIGPDERLWLHVLKEQEVPELPVDALPASYMVDVRYEPFLRKAAEKGSFTAWNLLGILLYEDTQFDEGIACFEKSLAIKENALACRNLFQAYQDLDAEKALAYMERAIALLGAQVSREYAEEYTSFLMKLGRHEQAWNFYQQLPADIKEDERLVLNILPAAIDSRQEDFLAAQYRKEFAIIREGERGYTESYFAYQAMKYARENDVPYTKELIQSFKEKNQVPDILDFRQSTT